MKRPYRRFECPNRQCGDYDLIGSENSCRVGRWPPDCPRACAWMEGYMWVWDERSSDDYDHEEALKRERWRQLQRSMLND